MLPHDEEIYRIALSRYPKITLDTARTFESHGVTPEQFFSMKAETLGAITGCIRPEYFDAKRREEILALARTEHAFISSGGIKAVYYTDADYPRRLAECNDAPAMVYMAGEPGALSAAHSIAIVGTRRCTAYGADFTRHLVEDLAEAVEGLVVVSGLAYGIDIAAHRAAVKADVPTAAVLAHGLNTIYPAEHRDDARNIIRHGGVLVTEYMSADAIHRGNFLARNRIIAGLADVTVVVESDVKGGAMATARLASAYDREVMALPGRVGDASSRGCLELIASNTASVIRDADDLIDVMGWQRRPKEGSQQQLDFDMPERFAAIADYVREHPGATANEICAHTGIAYARLSATLFEMEIQDYLSSLPGGRYMIPSFKS